MKVPSVPKKISGNLPLPPLPYRRFEYAVNGFYAPPVLWAALIFASGIRSEKIFFVFLQSTIDTCCTYMAGKVRTP